MKNVFPFSLWFIYLHLTPRQCIDRANTTRGDSIFTWVRQVAAGHIFYASTPNLKSMTKTPTNRAWGFEITLTVYNRPLHKIKVTCMRSCRDLIMERGRDSTILYIIPVCKQQQMSNTDKEQIWSNKKILLFYLQCWFLERKTPTSKIKDTCI